MTQQTSRDSHTSAADVFSYLLLFLMLYVASFAFLGLLFDYVDELFPKPTAFFGPGYGTNSIITSVSTLIVVWPVYVVMAWLTGKWMNRDKSRRNLAIRKWLVYLTLFVSAVTLIVDLIVLIYNFLSGGLSAAFGLKVVAVLLVAGAVFGYYLWDLRRTGAQTVLPRIFAIVGSAVLVVAVVGGFFLVGTPAEQRAQRFDENRILDLQSLQGEVFNFYSSKDVLPTEISELTNDVTGFVVPTDPDTKQPYTYTLTGTLSFEICANFATEQTYETGTSRPEYLIYPPYGLDQNWSHPAGPHCFEREIDPDLITPEVKVVQ